MKRLICLVFLTMALTGCSSENRELKQGMAFRSSLLSASGCRFSAQITADYGDAVHQFRLDCEGDQTGELQFTVSAPDTLAGISGRISDTGGVLTFEDTVLHIPLLTDEQLNPVSAPWILLKTLRSGYITSACTESENLRLTVNDSYEEDALQLDIWLKDGEQPVCADVLYDGKRILSMEITSFALL